MRLRLLKQEVMMDPREEYDPITDSYVVLHPFRLKNGLMMAEVYILWRWKDHNGGEIELYNGKGWEDPVDWSDWIHTPTVKYLSLNVNVRS